MPSSGSSAPNPAFSRILIIALATLVVAVAFGADFGLESGSGEGQAGWGESSSGPLMPWSNARKQRKVRDLQSAKLMLSTERRRRVESEKSLALARTKLGEVETRNEELDAQIASLETQLREHASRIMDLSVELARASVASPELVDHFLSLADEAIRDARFDTALALCVEASGLQASLVSEDPAQIARLEFIRATALVAMGDDAGAARSLARLLEVAPDFDLDEVNSSPKLVRALQEVRAERV